MTMKWNRWLLILILLGLIILAWREWRVAPKGYVIVDVLDVGQGDGIFITGPSGQQIVVDGGPDLSILDGIGRRMSFFDRSIDLLVLSHPHLDHIFAFPEILKRYNVKAVLITGMAYDQSRYEEFLKLLRAQQTPVIIADPAKDLDMGDGLRVDVLWPPPVYAGKEGDANNTSIVFKLTYGQDSMLFTGDMETEEEREVLSANVNIDSDILKAGHHGSRTSSSTGLLLAVSPDLAVISAGRENQFGHPHKEVLRRFEKMGIPYKTTATEGSVRLMFDGK
jgi:competence protein ComEC